VAWTWPRLRRAPTAFGCSLTASRLPLHFFRPPGSCPAVECHFWFDGDSQTPLTGGLNQGGPLFFPSPDKQSITLWQLSGTSRDLSGHHLWNQLSRTKRYPMSSKATLAPAVPGRQPLGKPSMRKPLSHWYVRSRLFSLLPGIPGHGESNNCPFRTQCKARACWHHQLSIPYNSRKTWTITTPAWRFRLLPQLVFKGLSG